MKKKIIFGIVFISLITVNLTTSFYSKKDVFSLVNLELLSSASAEDNEGGGGGGLLWEAEYTETPCTYTNTTTVRIYDPETGSYIYSTQTVTFTGKVKNCVDGWWFCLSDCVG